MAQKITKVILLIIFFIFVTGLFSVEIRDPDFWWHLKTGEYISQNRMLPETDPFAYTSTQKDPLDPESKRIHFVLTQYWLAQVLFYWIYSLFGLQGIIYLRAALLTILMLVLYRSIRREGMGFYSSLMLLIPGLLIFYTFTGERPQLFSFLFSFLIIFLLEGFRRSASVSPNLNESQPVSMSLNQSLRVPILSYLLPIPFLMLIWANLHGGFILGLVLLLGYTVAETVKYKMKKLGPVLPFRALKWLSATVIASVLLSLVNPNTYKVIPFLVEFESGLYKKMITESVPPITLLSSGFYEPQFILYFILLAITLLFLVFTIKKPDLTDLLIFTGLTVMSLSSSRYIPFFTPVAILLIARYGLKVLQNIPMKGWISELVKKWDPVIAIVLSITLIIVINNSDLFKQGIRSNKYPEGAAQFLKENHITGNMFNPYIWGGYLLWSLYPDYKVFVDGRGLIGEVFFQEVRILEADAQSVAGIPAWKALLDAYQVNFIVTFSVGNFSGKLVPLISALLNEPSWHLVYMDNISLIFVREKPENEGIIGRFALPKDWLWNEVAVEAALKAKDAPNKGDYYETMGDAFFVKRSYSEAGQAYRSALALKPGDSRIAQQLSILEMLVPSQDRREFR
ncbi:MAG: hypothetical protein RDU01_06245 [Thermodesulfovibrionales bacterium]|nr:hypothetical protein [Thermodesulfovibrionales bacterium]